MLTRQDSISLQNAQLKYDIIVQILETNSEMEPLILDPLKKYKSEGIFDPKKTEDLTIQWEGGL